MEILSDVYAESLTGGRRFTRSSPLVVTNVSPIINVETPVITSVQGNIAAPVALSVLGGSADASIESMKSLSWLSAWA